jgi:bacteriorhodopsin
MFHGVDMFSVSRRNPWLFYMLATMGLMFLVIALIPTPHGTE